MTTAPERERYLQRLWERPGRLRVNGDTLAALWWAVRTEQRRRSSRPAGGAA